MQKKDSQDLIIMFCILMIFPIVLGVIFYWLAQLVLTHWRFKSFWAAVLGLVLIGLSVSLTFGTEISHLFF